jgi:succinoglycan biosynthesis transport protein ExoP
LLSGLLPRDLNTLNPSDIKDEMTEMHDGDSHQEKSQIPARYPQAPQITPRNEVLVPPNDEEQEIHLLDYWRVITVRRWTILAIVLTAVTVTAISTFQQVPVYRATARLQIDRESSNVLSFQDVYAIDSSTDDELQTQFEILSARSLARRVVEELRLNEHAEFQPGEPGVIDGVRQSIISTVVNIFATEDEEEIDSGTGSADPLGGTTNAYLGRLAVAPVSQSRLVDISFEATDPGLAADAINSHARNFIDQNLQFKFDATQDASAFLEQQLVTLQANLEAAEEELQRYSIANNILFTGGGLNTAVTKLEQLQTQHTTMQGARIEKESFNRMIESDNSQSLPQLLNNPLILELSTRLALLESEDAELAVSFAPQWPGRRRIQVQIEGTEDSIVLEKERVISMIRSEYEAALESDRLLSEAVDDQVELVNRVNQEIIQYSILEREADSNKQLYDGLLTRLKEAGISAGLRASNIRIVDPALAPTSPIRPRPAVNLSLSLLASVLFGVGIVFFQDYLDNSIKSPEDVVKFMHVPNLGIVPKQGSLQGKRSSYGTYGAISESTKTSGAKESPVALVSAQSPTSVMSEAYRSMRTSLLMSSPDHPPRTILITSAVQSEGKTVTATNLAISLTQTGARVVLIDADMRKPRIHSIFALGTTLGLSAVLTGNAKLKEVLHEAPVDNLFVLPCGAIPPNPLELLTSSRFQRMMAALPDFFEYVVIDSPPLSNVSDGRVLAQLVDATILVVKAGSTSRHSIKNALGHLKISRANVVGAILNDVDVRMSGYEYYSYYQAGYYKEEPAEKKG